MAFLDNIVCLPEKTPGPVTFTIRNIRKERPKPAFLLVLENPGAWKWSHINWTPAIWIDDNAWMCSLQLIIDARWPELGEKYGMRKLGLALAGSLAEGFEKQFAPAAIKQDAWMGNLNKTHWGSLLCMALSLAHEIEPNERFRRVAATYHDYLSQNREMFNTSDQGYALLGATFAARAFGGGLFMELARYFADRLLAAMDPVTGNIPAQHKESPVGPHLVDTIYTVNWALVALHTFHSAAPEPQYEDAYE